MLDSVCLIWTIDLLSPKILGREVFRGMFPPLDLVAVLTPPSRSWDEKSRPLLRSHRALVQRTAAKLRQKEKKKKDTKENLVVGPENSHGWKASKLD